MGTCIGAESRSHEARTVRLPRSITDTPTGYLAGRPRDDEALVVTAALANRERTHADQPSSG